MPWLDAEPRLNKPFGLPEFETATAGLNVESFVYVQVDTTPAYGLLEARWAAQHPRVGAIVAWAPMEDGPVVRTVLEELLRIDPRIRGVRRLLQSEPDPDFAMRPEFISGVRLLPTYDLSFDICIKHYQLPASIQLVRSCPETRFILDHIAKPDIRASSLDPWREQMAELASLPNVVCKISGMVTEADHSRWTVQELQPYVEHVLKVFGEDRVMFGGDWPVVTVAAEYRRWVDTLAQLTDHVSAEAKTKLWRHNTRRVYRL
jgi:L-fuconolactonase